jgi:AraC-like DNA-binding protein
MILENLDEATLIDLLMAMAPVEGYNLSPMPSVRFLRSNRPLARAPVLYDPGIVIVCQGRKRGYFGGHIYRYDKNHYLAVSVPVPFTMETDASPEQPLLAIYLHLDFSLAAALQVEIDALELPAAVAAPRSMMSSEMDTEMKVSVLRFLRAMHHPRDAHVLGPALLREVYYRVLTGPQGPSMRAALAMRAQFGKIGQALQHIHSHFADAIDLSGLAQKANMSVPTFHSHFKAITQTSPMQYVKSVRLHQARLLMLRQGMTADASSRAVGYASVSQFTREFRRLFGLSPVAETRRMRNNFQLPPAFDGSAYVSSH